MKEALACAGKAARRNEVPIGCVIVKDGKILARGRNKREGKKNAVCHAEIMALSAACKKLRAWRLCGCQLYVTLEPCPMCAGAILNARVDRVVFGAPDPKAGAFGTVLNLNEYPLNHTCALTAGVLAKECGDILSDFFRRLRVEKSKNGNTKKR